MHSDVDRRAPIEACGLVAGQSGTSISVFPTRNLLASPTRYQMDPVDQVRSMLAIQKQGLDLLAIYHSHPYGPRHPSPLDIAEAAYPEAAYLIWSRDRWEWTCRAFMIAESRTIEVELELIQSTQN